MSTPKRSLKLANSFMNEIRVASMALAAYLVNSAERWVITKVRSWWRLKGAYRLRIWPKAHWPMSSLATPSTMRSGRMKSSTAAPSFKNSGFETTAQRSRAWPVLAGLPSKSMPLCCNSLAIAACTRSAVPTGTVDLLTTTLSVRIQRPMSLAALSA